MNVENGGQELDYLTPDDGSASEAVEANTSEHDDAELELDAETGDETENQEGDDETVSNEEETEELELSGKKYKVHKDLRPLLMMQQDYTRKTQEVAAEKRELDAHREAVKKAREEVEQHSQTIRQNLQGYAELASIDKTLAEYQKVDWATLEQQDIIGAQSAWRKFQQLQQQRQQLAGHLQRSELEAKHKASEAQKRLEAEQHANREKAAAETLKVLQRDIKGWNDKVAGEVAEFALKEGYTRDELVSATGDPRAFKLLHKAMQFDKLVAKQKAAKASAEPAKPLTRVGGRSAPAVTGLDDRLSADEWIKRRNEQTRGARA